MKLETLIHEASKSYKSSSNVRRRRILFATSISGNTDAANLDRVLALGTALRDQEQSLELGK